MVVTYTKGGGGLAERRKRRKRKKQRKKESTWLEAACIGRDALRLATSDSTNCPCKDCGKRDLTASTKAFG